MLEKILEDQNVPEGSFLKSCKAIFDITFGQTIRSKKTVFILIAAFLPVLLAILYRVLGRDMQPDQPFARIMGMSPERALSLIMPFFLQFLSVLIALFYATALIADEIENRTITYLFTRPVRKYSIILGKYASYLLEVLLILVPPMLITFLIIATGSGASSSFAAKLGVFSQQFGVIVLALIVYGAIFTFFGAWWKRPLLLGLIFAFGWEKTIIAVPGAIRKFSVIHYLTSAFPKLPPMRGFPIVLPKGASANTPVFISVIVLLVITCVFLGLSIFTVYRKEYKFE